MPHGDLADAVPVRPPRQPGGPRPPPGTIAALVPVLVGGSADGVFGESTSFSRLRVQSVFEAAVTGARDAPAEAESRSLGRLLYLSHLVMLLWWSLDRTPGQAATEGLVGLLERALPAVALALRLPRLRRLIRQGDELVTAGLPGYASPR